MKGRASSAWACVFLLVALPVACLKADDPSRLDKIEEDLSLLTRFLRQSIEPSVADVQEPVAAQVVPVTPPHVTAPVVPRVVPEDTTPSVSESVPKIQATPSKTEFLRVAEDPKPEISILDLTVPVLPDSVLSDSVPGPEFVGGDEAATIMSRQHHYLTNKQRELVDSMPEVTASSSEVSETVRVVRSRDTVVCAGYPLECSGKGMCDHGLCRCDPLWFGEDCSMPRCFPSCSSHGQCINGTCECDNGWAGQTCSDVACYPECTEHGVCNNGVCVCEPGYSGDDCSQLMCAGNSRCGGVTHGACNGTSGLCECLPEWGGVECLDPMYPCVYDCLNNGYCYNGTCMCAPGWEGVDCNVVESREYLCEGGSVWTTNASPYLRTCENMHQAVAGTEPPQQGIAKCACPTAAPIWDTATRQCVEEAFCYTGECGDVLRPGPYEVIVTAKTKSACSWSSPQEGTCPGCSDASEQLTVCFKAGHFVAESITTAREAVVALYRDQGPCAGETIEMSLGELINATSPQRVTSQSVDDDGDSTTATTTTVTTVGGYSFEGVPHVTLNGTTRKSGGSVKLNVGCVGTYSARLVVVGSTGLSSVYGDCSLTVENATCPGTPPCSGRGACTSGFQTSTCTCADGYFGSDCSLSATGSGNNTVTSLPLNITTLLPIPPTATVLQLEDRVVVTADDTQYIFFPDGTTEIHYPSGEVVILPPSPLDNVQNCAPTTSWRACSLGCFPSCRNPNPRCTPTCLFGACQCPSDTPLWDDMLNTCVAEADCSEQLPCPGIGAVCSGKGTCDEGRCLCSPGFSGDDCSQWMAAIPRVTTSSGTTQMVTPCRFPFYFRGKEYTDCTTDFDSEGREWCSTTYEWEHQWGYCEDRGACPSKDGVACNGRGLCVDGVCQCDALWSGADCSVHYMRYTNQTFQQCTLPFVGPDMQEHYDCIEGLPITDDDDAIVGIAPSSNGDSWCLTSFTYTGPSSFAWCQPAGSCGGCDPDGGVCDVAGSGACKCRPGYDGQFCVTKLTEREILIKLFTETNGLGWNRHAGWGEGDPCDAPGWSGITCNDNGHVIRINLDSVGLAGHIPADISALAHLEILDLSNNALVGVFPDALVRSPRTLVSISVSGNMLVGSIPVLPARIIYSDFTQNYFAARTNGAEVIIPRVTDGTGTADMYTSCVFPFEFHGHNYTTCTRAYSEGAPWCATSAVYDGSWGVCAPPGTCPGSNDLQCSGNGVCHKVQMPTGIGATCECETGFMGSQCSHPITRVTQTVMRGAVEEHHGQECVFPFEYQGKTYTDCTTDGSELGREWCLLSNVWERTWGYCAPLGRCPGAKHSCSGHGTCDPDSSKCTCDDGWTWNDCSQKVARVTVGHYQQAGSVCHFPFTLGGVTYNDCTTAPTFEGEPYCAVKGGALEDHQQWDFCAPIGTCPGSPQCSASGTCIDGECSCDPGYYGSDCSSQMGEVDVLAKLFRSTHGQLWLNSYSWEDGDFCQWAGITCNAGGHVEEINLSGNGLDGTLPEELGDLYKLKVLDLSNNMLAGTIPHSLSALPELTTLNLSFNQFVGSLPEFNIPNTVMCDNNCIHSPLCPKASCEYFPFTEME